MNDVNFMESILTTQYELHRQILEVIALIPYGKVATYGQVARMAGLPKHARLVGYVLKHLEVDHQVPWYRVINSQGKISLSKFNEKGENIQQLKLEAEGVYLLNGKVDLKAVCLAALIFMLESKYMQKNNKWCSGAVLLLSLMAQMSYAEKDISTQPFANIKASQQDIDLICKQLRQKCSGEAILWKRKKYARFDLLPNR